MATVEERMRVLKLIEEGKISGDEGARLLAALEKSTKQTKQTRAKKEADPKGDGGSGRWIRLRVSDSHSGKTRVNMTIPLGLVNMGLAVGARFVPDVADLDVDALRDALRSGMQGKILEVNNDDELVEIYVE